MAKTGRYTYCPMAGTVRRNLPSLAGWIRRRRFRKSRKPDLYMVSDYYPAYYPVGYKK